MRPIDADALLEELKKTYKYFDLKFYIDEAPTIDVNKVQTPAEPIGEWIQSKYVCSCSHCGYLVTEKTPWCPNCGTHMKGEYK